MAQLKNLIVNGASRFIGDIYANLVQLTTLIAPSSTNSTTYSAGTNGQFVKSNGNSIYWTNLEASDIPNLNASKITDGILPVTHGGTGNTSFTKDTLIYANTTTKLASYTSTKGGAKKLWYLNAGVPTDSNETVGNGEKPVYLNAGTITALGPVWLLRGGTAITTDTELDLNNYLTIGNYYIASTSYADDILHTPYSNTASSTMTDGVIKVYSSLGSSADYLKQEYILYNSGRHFVRHKQGASANWTGWRAYAFTPAGTDIAIGAGDTELPIYVKATGELTPTAYHLKAHVEDGSENHLAYYSAARTIDYTSNITFVNGLAADVGTGKIYGLEITGSVTGAAANLKAGEVGILLYGDAGPLLRFNSNSQKGAIIFTEYNDMSDGGGASFHFVTDQSSLGAAVRARYLTAGDNQTAGRIRIYLAGAYGDISANDKSSYGALKLTQSKGSYVGLLIGNNSDSLTIMDSGTSKGLYAQGTIGWLIYGHNTDKTVGIRTSSITSGYDIELGGTTHTSKLIHIDINSGTNLDNSRPLMIGPLTGINLAIGRNAIQARNNGEASILYLNYNAGSIQFGSSTSLTAPTKIFGTVTPGANWTTATYDLGSTSLRWNLIHAKSYFIEDTRDENLTAATNDRAIRFFFSNNDMPTSSTYYSGIHVRGWAGGYSSWELVGPSHNADLRTIPLYLRTSNKNGDWGSWRAIVLSNDTNSFTLNQGTANRAAYYSAAGSISQTNSIYMDTSHITINGTAIPVNSGNFLVIGTSTMRTILPETHGSYSIGDTSAHWGPGYFNTFYISNDVNFKYVAKNGDIAAHFEGNGLYLNKTDLRIYLDENIISARLYLQNLGTTSEAGVSMLLLGNNISTTEENNSSGTLRLYSPNSGYMSVKASTVVRNHMHYLPIYSTATDTSSAVYYGRLVGIYKSTASGDSDFSDVGSTSLPVYVTANGIIKAISLKPTLNNLLNSLTEGTADTLVDAGYIISTNNNGTTNDWYLRSNVTIWNYIKGKYSSTDTTLDTGPIHIRSSSVGGNNALVFDRASGELLYIQSKNPDNNISIVFAASNTDANTTYRFTKDEFYPKANNSKNLGLSSNKWANVYATNFNGALKGNADTATKWAAAQKVYVTLGTASTTTTIQGGSTSAQTIGVDGTLGTAHGGTGAITELGARLNLDIPLEDILSYRSDLSGKHYIKTSLTCGSSNFSIGFRIIAESTYTTKKPSIIIGSGYWNHTSNTFTNAVYYDATKNLNGIELIATDDNILFIALDPPSTYLRYKVFVYYGTNRNKNYAIERVDTAPTATITVAMTRIASYDATRLSSTGTTALFWRGDNDWSNELSGGLLKITNNSNTVTIGSANASYTHFSNSANIPFYFNKTILVDGDLYPYGTSNTHSLGSSSKRWKSLLIGTADSYGGITKPIYWKDGVPTELSETVGATDKPVFLSSGTITAGLPVWTLTNPTLFATNESFNDKITIGNYYISANAVATTIPDEGKPGTGSIYGTLKVSKIFTGITNANYLRQDWFAHSSAKHFMRRTNGSAEWSGWSAYAYIPPDATTKKPIAVGSTSLPVYIKNDGEITALDYTIEKSVPSNAVFTDNKVSLSATATTYWRKVLLNGGSSNTYSDWDDAVVASTDVIYQSKSVAVLPSTGKLHAMDIIAGNTTSTDERRFDLISSAGLIYMFSAGSATGNRGIFIPAHGNGDRRYVIRIDSDNVVGFAGGSGATAATTGVTALTSTIPGSMSYFYNVHKDTTGLYPKTNNANAILTLNRYTGTTYVSLLGFSSDGNIYYRDSSNSSLNTTTAWKQITFTEPGTVNELTYYSDSNTISPSTIVINKTTKHIAGFINGGLLSGTSLGTNATAEGTNTTASGLYSHAEGEITTASAQAAHAEGSNTIAGGIASHAEGGSTLASGADAHAEGGITIASGSFSHAEGYGTAASGNASHAEGVNTTASGLYSHAEGYRTNANHKSLHVFGEYNIADSSAAAVSSRGTYIEIVGNGEDNSNRSNARTLDWSGNEYLAGNLIPMSDNTQSIGTNTNSWQNAYVNNIYIKGSGTGLTVLKTNLTGATNRNIYLPNYGGNGYLLFKSSTSAVGSSSLPVYIASNGRAIATTGLMISQSVLTINSTLIKQNVYAGGFMSSNLMTTAIWNQIKTSKIFIRIIVDLALTITCNGNINFKNVEICSDRTEYTGSSGSTYSPKTNIVYYYVGQYKYCNSGTNSFPLNESVGNTTPILLYPINGTNFMVIDSYGSQYDLSLLYCYVPIEYDFMDKTTSVAISGTITFYYA